VVFFESGADLVGLADVAPYPGGSLGIVAEQQVHPDVLGSS
jgi:hypothetical protein